MLCLGGGGGGGNESISFDRYNKTFFFLEYIHVITDFFWDELEKTEKKGLAKAKEDLDKEKKARAEAIANEIKGIQLFECVGDFVDHCNSLETTKEQVAFAKQQKKKFKADHKFKIKAENKIKVAYDPHTTSDNWFKEIHHAYEVPFLKKSFKY